MIAVVVVASSLLLAAGCLPFALTSATSGVQTLADGELPDKFIMVDYSTSYTLKLGDYYDARAGSIYLILGLEIENHGYDSFSANPMFWSVIIVPKTAESAGFEIKYTPFLGGVQLITREI